MGKMIDLTGQIFGRLRAMKYTYSKNGRAYWLCLCTCPKGTKLIVSSTNLISGNTKSCGCFRKEVVSMSFYEDLTGQVFGRLKVIKDVGRDKCEILETSSCKGGIQ